MDKRIVSLVNDATIGLQVDAELRLDVQAELNSHLDRAVQAGCAAGKEEEESVEEALQEFGSPLELAGEILDANRRRLRLRALARLAMQAVLLPLALILTIFQGVKVYRDFQEYGLYLRPFFMGETYQHAGCDCSDEPKESISFTIFRIALEPFKSPFGEFDNFYIVEAPDDLPLPHRFSGMPPIATGNPENKIFWGYYATEYIKGDRPGTVAIAEHGKLIDPGNALYNYMLANHYLHLSYDFPFSEGKRPILKDKQLFLLGIEELRQAELKKMSTSYRNEMRKKRYQRMGSAENYADHLRYIICSWQDIYPENSILRELTRQSETMTYYLIEMGRADLVEVPLSLSIYLSRQLITPADDFTYITIARGIAVHQGSKVADFAEKAGYQDMAKKLRENKRLFDLVIPLEKQSSKSRNGKSFQRSNGIVTSAIIFESFKYPAGTLTKEKLAPSRNLDYLLFDRIMFSLLQVVLLALLVWSSICWGIWAFNQRKRGGAGLLLLPPALVAVRIAVVGILLPLVLYFSYTLLPAINGRNGNIYYIGNRMLLELSILCLVILALPVLMATHYLHLRFHSLHLPIPPLSFRWKVHLASALFVLLPLPIYYVLQWVQTLYFTRNYEWYIFPAIEGILFIVGTICLYVTYIKVRTHAQYFGILYRSLLPIYALALLLVAAVTQPYFTQREARLVAAEQLVLPKSADMQPPIERILLEQIKSNLLASEGK